MSGPGVGCEYLSFVSQRLLCAISYSGAQCAVMSATSLPSMALRSSRELAFMLLEDACVARSIDILFGTSFSSLVSLCC